MIKIMKSVLFVMILAVMAKSGIAASHVDFGHIQSVVGGTVQTNIDVIGV